MPPRSVTILILIHIGITLVGLAVHLDLHPPGKSLFFWWPFLTGAISLFVIPVLYALPATAAYGFLFNVMMVVIGTLGMSYYSLFSMEGPFTFYRLAAESTLPKIFVLLSKLPIGWFIVAQMKTMKKPRPERGCLR